MTDLAQQPPPRKNAKPGYYPDPLGTGRARWWDGSSWTLTVGPRVSPDDPPGKPVASPKKHCRHCGAQSETFGDKCPNCGRGYGTSTGVIVASVIAACVAIVVVLGGCAVLVGVAIEKAGDEIEEDAITERQFDSIKPGATRAQVEAELGKPVSREEFTKPPVSCIYYAQQGEGLFGANDFEFCFRDGALHSKRVD